MQKINIFFITSAMVLGAMFVGVSYAQAGCVTGSWANMSGNGIQATLNVTNNPSCGPTQVSLCSYRVYIQPNNTGWLSSQTLFDSKVITLQPGQTVTMAVNTDKCMNQVDAYTGPCVNPFASDNTSVPNIFAGKMTDYTQLCSKCINDCSTDSLRVCDGNGFKQCSKGADGCFHWTHSDCQANQACNNGSCVASCTNDCSVQDQRVCDGNGFKQCSKGADGCFHWGTINNCQTGELCNNGSCIPQQTCTNDCNVRDQRVCDGNGYKQCTQGSDGCLHWSGITNCQTSEICNNGSCNNITIAPTVSLRTNGSVTCNQSATLSWTSANADSCNASGSWSGSKSTNGSESVGSFTGSRTYTIVCTGRGGSATDSVSLNGSSDNLSVNAGSDKYTTDNNSVILDGSVKGDADRLSWSCTGGNLSNNEALKPDWKSADSYNDRNFGNGNDSDQTYTCTLTARNECGSDSDSMTVHVRHNCQPKVYEAPTVYPVRTNYAQVSQVNIQKWVSDLSNGSPWSVSVNANPSDAVSYKIIVTAVQGDTDNISISDAMPAGIANVRNLQIDGVMVNGDLGSATNIGGLRQSQTRIITFDATVANENNFIYGQTALTNTATVYANGATANASATVNVYRHAVMGATTVSTGFDGNTAAGIGMGIAAAFLGIVLFIKKTFASKKMDSEAGLAQRLDLIKNGELA